MQPFVVGIGPNDEILGVEVGVGDEQRIGVGVGGLVGPLHPEEWGGWVGLGWREREGLGRVVGSGWWFVLLHDYILTIPSNPSSSHLVPIPIPSLLPIPPPIIQL